MADDTKIEWADYTFSPWWGCQEVSPGCANCYAKTWATRFGRNQLWGARGQRMPVSDGTWMRVHRWNRDADRSGRPALVFCASMADVFEDHPTLAPLRPPLWDLISSTPNLIWLLLTKRPENILNMVPRQWVDWERSHLDWPANVWVGTSVENEDTAVRRLNHLRQVPAPVRFVSAEPLLEQVDLTPWMSCRHESLTGFDGVPASVWQCDHCCAILRGDGPHRTVVKGPQLIDWVITGGESGASEHIRPVHPDWIRRLRDDCASHDIPFFFKQWGAYLPVPIEDAPDFAGGRAFANPRTGGRSAASIRPRAEHWGQPTPSRPMKAGDRNGLGRMLDDNTIAVRIGKTKAGALLDGVEHKAFPAAARRKMLPV